MSAPKIDMSKPHPRPRPFHNAAECGVCKGHHAPPIADQAAHQAHVQLEADRLISSHREQQAAFEAHQAEEAHRDNVQAVTGFRPKTWAEVLVEQPAAVRLLLDPGAADKADVAAVKARAAADARTLDRRAAAAKLAHRRARLSRAIAELPVDAFDAIKELREQLGALDREAVAAGQEPEAMAALADALDPAAAATVAPAAKPEPIAAPPKRDPALALLLGSE